MVQQVFKIYQVRNYLITYLRKKAPVVMTSAFFFYENACLFAVFIVSLQQI